MSLHFYPDQKILSRKEDPAEKDIQDQKVPVREFK